MSRNYSRKSKIKTIIAVILTVASVIGAVAGIAALVNKNKTEDGLTKVNAGYEIGALSATGDYEESEGSLYTKEAFECEGGVKVELDFDATVKYKVFFYNDNDAFISASEELDKTATTEAPEGATHARVMVTPIWDADVDTEDQVIKWYNKGTYTKQLTVYTIEAKEAAEEAAA